MQVAAQSCLDNKLRMYPPAILNECPRGIMRIVKDGQAVRYLFAEPVTIQVEAGYDIMPC